MSYQVIARKYRPQRFEDVVGQEHVSQTLANAITQNRIAHAYLFVGPRGTGKTTMARIFAKCLNCTNGPRIDFPDDDPKANEITDGRSMDVLEIDGASNRGIDEIRELRDTVKYAPASSKFKIYIIDEVHMLTKEAFNALLKTLEEPPEHVKFMFATTEPDKILPTILSRCQRFDLRRIPSALIVKHLAQIAEQENVKIDPAALQAIARGADGGMRDAESTLDQLISFCGKEIVESDVLSMFGLAAQSQIFALTDAVLSGAIEEALRQLNDLAKQGKELGRIVSELLNHFRNLLIYQVSKGDLQLIEASESEGAVLAQQSSKIGPDALARIMEVLTDCEGRLRDAASKKILVEVTLLRMIEARNAVSIDTVLKQLQQLRAEGTTVSAPAQSRARQTPVSAAPASTGSSEARSTSMSMPTAAPVVQAAPAVSALAAPAPAAPGSSETRSTSMSMPVAAPAAAPNPVFSSEATPMHDALPGMDMPLSVGEVDLGKVWKDLLDAVGRVSEFTRSLFIVAFPVSLGKNVLTIGFEPEFAEQIGLVDNPKNHTLLQTKLSEMGLPNFRVKFVKADAPVGWSRPQATPAPEPSPSAAPVAPAAPKTAPEAKAPKAAAAPKGAGSAAAEPPKPKLESVPFSKEDFKNDPLIQKALEIFKGEIIDVRS